MPQPASPTPRPRRRVRSYTPRFRTSALTQARLADLLPRYGVRGLPVDPIALFGREAPLVLEIGSGHGAAAMGYATSHPGHDVLVAEIHVPGVARMLAAAEGAGVTNLRAYIGDAMDLLTEGLPPGSLSRVHLLFPDPWPKRRHEKRRLVQRHTLDAIATALAPGGVLLLATDHPVYAAHARAQLAAHGGFAVGDVHRPAWKPLDGFEAKGLSAGRPAFYLQARPVGIRRVSGDAGA